MQAFIGSETLTWIAIVLCVSQSAIFSGLNLAFFSLSRLRLEVEAAGGNANAQKVLALRQDPNLLLTTVLIGNVAVNVLLTLLSDSVLTGVSAFFFSTVVITAFGEIVPQAYFSRNALQVTSLLSPLFSIYRTVLYPITKPVAWLLDRWLGKEGFVYLREKQFRYLLRKHIQANDAEIDRIEGLGALNFLAIDDLPLVQLGEPLNDNSIVRIPFRGDAAVFPEYATDPHDPFLQAVHASGEKWVVLVDDALQPRLVMDADGFLRDALFSERHPDPRLFCHRPIVARDANQKLGSILASWNVQPAYPGDNVVDNDLILLWGKVKKVITGADILGRLLMGITRT